MPWGYMNELVSARSHLRVLVLVGMHNERDFAVGLLDLVQVLSVYSLQAKNL